MPFPDRSKPWPTPAEGGATTDGPRKRDEPAPAETTGADTQYFDPSEPWDPQSAEALTRLHESDEGRLWKRHEGAPAQRRAPLHSDCPAQGSTWESALLEPRLTGLMQRLQDALEALDPDRALAPLGRRLDAVEQRLAEALSGVAQRSDVEGLRLIEAQVTELAAHVDQMGLRIQRLDVMDERVGELARKLDEDGVRRLDALERLLQSYVSEWRDGNERTSATLGALDETLTRIGSSIDAAEAIKPAPDLSLASFETDPAPRSEIGADPLSQVYADGARALSASHAHTSLDAADYTAGAPLQVSRPAVAPEAASGVPQETAGEEHAPAATHRTSEPAANPSAAASSEDRQASGAVRPPKLAPPAFRASAVRAKLRQIRLADAESAGDSGPPMQEMGPATEIPDRTDNRSVRPSLLLAAGITLFAAAGYLLVDVFLSPHPQAPKQSHEPGGEHSGKRVERQIDPGSLDTPGRTGRVDAFGSALAAIFRDAPAPVTPAAYKEAPAPSDDTLSTIVTPPAATIGPASLRQAAINGDPVAQYEIGTRYAAGRGVAQDLATALQWYRRAAARGLASAQFRLAAMHERGQGTSVDTEKARIWYQRAAEQGHVKAMHNLAVLSVSGGRTDYGAAAKWFKEAAERGLADSQFNLAVLYQNGLGLPRDLKLAYQWLSLAARGGDQEAASRLAVVRSQLSPADLSAVDATVAAWRVRAPEPDADGAPAAASSELQ